MSYYIYKMIHQPSGRVYIGKHRLPKGKTPDNDGYYGSGIIWKRIYNKNPEECTKVVLDYAISKDEINELEIKYIKHYKEVYGDLCVNIAKGGDGGSNKIFTDEELKEHKKSYYQRMKEYKKAYQKSYRESNKQKCRESHKAWAAKNKDYYDSYYEKHKEVRKAQQRAYRARKKLLNVQSQSNDKG